MVYKNVDIHLTTLNNKKIFTVIIPLYPNLDPIEVVVDVGLRVAVGLGFSMIYLI